jgi:predicted transcriptional regulator
VFGKSATTTSAAKGIIDISRTWKRQHIYNGRTADRRFLVGRPDIAERKMSEVKVTVGGALEGDASRRFVEAWRRAKHGETFHERHLAFASWDALARVLTGKRMELLRHVRRHEVASVRALAKALGRDYSNVHADVQALSAAGLLDTGGGRFRADYDAIETRIAI